MKKMVRKIIKKEKKGVKKATKPEKKILPTLMIAGEREIAMRSEEHTSELQSH